MRARAVGGEVMLWHGLITARTVALQRSGALKFIAAATPVSLGREDADP